jgi:hypothetical protein
LRVFRLEVVRGNRLTMEFIVPQKLIDQSLPPKKGGQSVPPVLKVTLPPAEEC